MTGFTQRGTDHRCVDSAMQNLTSCAIATCQLRNPAMPPLYDMRWTPHTPAPMGKSEACFALIGMSYLIWSINGSMQMFGRVDEVDFERQNEKKRKIVVYYYG
jgi:hypothetical protein